MQVKVNWPNLTRVKGVNWLTDSVYLDPYFYFFYRIRWKPHLMSILFMMIC